MIQEHLPSLALESFELAQKLCAECRGYHATWGYLRVAGLRDGATSDIDLLTKALTGLADPVRVLIAGSADTGQVAAMASVLEGRRYSITLADICETPLALCRGFAESQGIPLRALREDIANAHVHGPFDAVLFHNFLGFLERDQRQQTLRALRAALTPQGRLIIIQRAGLKPETATAEIDGEAVAACVVTELKQRGVALPEDEASFRKRIAAASHNQGRIRRLTAFSSVAQLEDELREAGYGMIEVSDADRESSGPVAWRRKARRYMLLARP